MGTGSKQFMRGEMVWQSRWDMGKEIGRHWTWEKVMRYKRDKKGKNVCLTTILYLIELLQVG